MQRRWAAIAGIAGAITGVTQAQHHHQSQGSWRAVIDIVKSAQPADPEEMLRLTTYKILALCKLRMYSAAFDELNTLGGLDSPQYQRDGPGGQVSLVPFAMRWISAQLPGLLGRAAYAVDELYKLAAQCQQQAGGRLDRRTQLVLFTLINYHVRCVLWEMVNRVLGVCHVVWHKQLSSITFVIVMLNVHCTLQQ